MVQRIRVRIITVGERKTGKTSLIHKYVRWCLLLLFAFISLVLEYFSKQDKPLEM